MDPDKSLDYLIVFYINVKLMIVLDPEFEIVVEYLTT